MGSLWLTATEWLSSGGGAVSSAIKATEQLEVVKSEVVAVNRIFQWFLHEIEGKRLA